MVLDSSEDTMHSRCSKGRYTIIICTGNQRTCSYLLGNKGMHCYHGNPRDGKDETSMTERSSVLIRERLHESVGFIRLYKNRKKKDDYGFGIGFRVGDEYLMTAYHVLDDKIDKILERCVIHMESRQDTYKKVAEKLMVEETDLSSDTVLKILRNFMIETSTDVNLLMTQYLNDVIDTEFLSSSLSEHWEENCVVEFSRKQQFTIDWKIAYGNKEHDVIIVKLNKTQIGQQYPRQLLLDGQFRQDEEIYMMKCDITNEYKIVVDQKCVVYKNDAVLRDDIDKALKWWAANSKHRKHNFSPDNFFSEAMGTYPPAHNDVTGHVILRASRSFVQGASGSPMVYLFNSDGQPVVRMIYQQGYPIFYYNRQIVWDDNIIQIDPCGTFEGCTTMKKVEELLAKHGKQELKENIFSQPTESSRVSSAGGTSCHQLLDGRDFPNFIETRASSAVIGMINKEDVVTVIGAPGSGKSYCMRHAAYLLQKDGYQVYDIDNCQEILDKCCSEFKQAFVIDDPFGEGMLDKESLKQWVKSDRKIKKCLAIGKTKLLLTIRKETMNLLIAQGKLPSSEIRKNIIDINSEELRMDVKERKDFFGKYIALANLKQPSPEVKRFVEICELDFFPLLCHMYCTDEYFRKKPDDLFQNPYGFLDQHFKDIRRENPSQFFGLILCALYKGSLPRNIFDSFRKDTKERKKVESIMESFDKTVQLDSVRRELDSLHGVFVYKNTSSYTFIHSTFRDIVSFVLGREENSFAIEHCGLEFIIERCRLSRTVEDVRGKMYAKLDTIDDTSSISLDELNAIGNKFSFQIDETLEADLAASILKQLSERSMRTNEFFNLYLQLIESHFFQDEQFLETFYSAMQDDPVLCEDGRRMFLYGLFTNACLIGSRSLLQKIHTDGALINPSIPTPIGKSEFSDSWEYSLTPLLACSFNGDDEMVEKLLKFPGTDIDHMFENWITPMGLAVLNEKLSTVKVLKSHEAKLDIGSPPPLIVATKVGYSQGVDLLLGYGAMVDIRDENDVNPLEISVGNNYLDITKLLLRFKASTSDPTLLLCTACDHGNMDLIELLLDLGAKVNRYDGEGRTPLQLSIERENYEVTELLLRNKADANVCLQYDSVHPSPPLFIACKKGIVGLINLLVRYHADINRCNYLGCSPLVCAVDERNVEVLRLLLKLGADIDKCGVSKPSSTPLCTASCNGAFDLVELLLTENASVNKCDGKGRTPLFHAVNRNHFNIAQLLIRHGAEVDICDENLRTPLIKACLKGYKNMAELLINNNADLTKSDRTGMRPIERAIDSGNFDIAFFLFDANPEALTLDSLCIACRKGNVDLVRKLMSTPFNVNKKDSHGNTPLICAVRSRKKNIVEELLDNFKADVDLCETESMSSPLDYACSIGDVSIVNILLGNNPKMNERDQSEYTILSRSVYSNSSQIVSLLLKHGADANLTGRSINAMTPLGIACKRGYIDIVEQLLNHNADINLRDMQKDTALHCSLEHQQTDIAKLLLERNADVNICNRNLTSSLWTACYHGFADVVELLLSKKAEVNGCESDRETPLQCAVQTNNFEIAKILLKHNASANICQYGSSPLATACQRGYKDLVKLLLQYDIDVNLCDQFGRSPLEMCVNGNNETLVDVLLKRKADVNNCGLSETSSTPLCTASSMGYVHLVECLLKAGADVNKCDGQGRSPLERSVDGNFADITKLLLSYNAGINICGENSLTPLFIACERGFDTQVDILLEYHPDIDICDGYGRSPLERAVDGGHLGITEDLLLYASQTHSSRQGVSLHEYLCSAIKKRNSDVVQIILKFKVDVNKCDASGMTPLLYAVYGDHIDTARLLLENHADPNQLEKGYNTYSPLCAAARRGNTDMIVHLLIHGGDINMSNLDGLTPLGIACRDDDTSMARLLIRFNANVDQTDVHKITPLGYCVHAGNISTTQLLLEKGADVNLVCDNTFPALSVASQRGFESLAELLLRYSADINKLDQNDCSPLCIACQEGRKNMVELLVKNNANFEKNDKTNMVAIEYVIDSGNFEIAFLIFDAYPEIVNIDTLCIACKKGNVALVRKLMSARLNVNKHDSYGNTPLIYAVRGRKKNIVEELLDNFGADVNLCESGFKFSPLYWACSIGDALMVKILLRHNPNLNEDNQLGYTILGWSVYRNSSQIVPLLLNHGADTNLTGSGINALTPLGIACNHGFADIVEVLLTKGAEVNGCESDNETPLQVATQKNNFNIAKILLKYNANANMCRYSYSPLAIACERGYMDFVELLLQYDIDVNLCDQYGRSPLERLVYKNNEALVNDLLKLKADVDRCGLSETSSTPLCTASSRGYVQLVECLLKAGANVNKRDGQGRSPLERSVDGNFADITKLLLSYNAGVNICGENSWTPLFTACERGFDTQVDILLEYHPDVNICDGYGRSPFERAVDGGYFGITENLLLYASKTHSSRQGVSLHEYLCSAIKKRNSDLFQIILKFKVDVNKCDAIGTTPLLYAVYGDHIDTARLLLENNADPNKLGEGDNIYSPLCAAARRSNTDMIDLLLMHGGDINMSNLYGLTPLGIACRDDDTIMARLLIRFDANVDQTDDHMITPLGYCVHAGNISTTQLLLEKGADVNLVCDNTFPALSVASQRGFESLAELLLRYSADINKLDQNDCSPLCIACQEGRKNMVELLVKNNANFEKNDKTNMVAIEYVIDSGNFEIAFLIFDAYPEIVNIDTLCIACKKGNVALVRKLMSARLNVNKHDSYGNTPLIYAVRGRKKNIVEELLDNFGADVNLCESGFKFSPLYWACSIGDALMVKILLRHNPNLNEDNQLGYTILGWSVYRNSSQIVPLLLNHGADTNLTGSGINALTPLGIACNHGFADIVEVLLTKGAEVNGCKSDNETPLQVATQKNNFNIAKILLKYNANANMCRYSYSPLAIACERGYMDFVELLLQYDIDVNLCDQYGRSPLERLVYKNNEALVNDLLKLKADVDRCGLSETSSTPLCTASSRGYVQLVECLLKAGANVNKRDGQGRSPLERSVDGNFADITKLLLSYNAGVNICGENSWTPLFTACERGFDTQVDILLEYHPDVNICDGYGRSPFERAVDGGYFGITENLLLYASKTHSSRQGVSLHEYLCSAIKKRNSDLFQIILKFKVDVNKCDAIGTTPLLYAVYGDHIDTARLLLENNADPNKLGEGDNIYSPLCAAARRSNTDMIDLLLMHGGDINMSNLYGLTPLGIACRDDDTIMARLLIRFDANVDQTDDHMITPLGYCVHAGNISTTQLLLEKGADVNLVCDNTFPALSVASQRGFESLAELLLRYSADINKLDQNDCSPLCIACQEGRKNMVELLVKNNANFEKNDKTNMVAIEYVIDSGNFEIAFLIFDAYPEIVNIDTLCIACKKGNVALVRKLMSARLNVNKHDSYGNTPLIYAVRGRKKNIVEELLDNFGADVNLCESGFKFSPLYWACSIGDALMVKILLRHNPNLNEDNQLGYTILGWSVYRNSSQIVPLLLNHGADTNLTGSGINALTPLGIACNHGFADIVEVLLTKGAEVNGCKSDNETPLQVATQKNNFNIAKILLKYNANANMCRYSYSPLAIACERGYMDFVELLLQYDIDVNLCDQYGRSPLERLVYKNNEALVNDLLKLKADVDRCGLSETSSTPLCTASSRGYVQLVECLLKAGANVNKRDGQGRSPLERSVDGNFADITKLLLSYNAGVNICGENSWTPLFTACERGFDTQVDILLEYHPDVNICDGYGRSPFERAVDGGYFGITENLLLYASKTHSSRQGVSLHEYLCSAIKKRNSDLFQIILKFKVDVNKCDAIGTTPLLYAVYGDHIDTARLLLENNADPNKLGEGDNIYSPLCAAARRSNTDMIDLLLMHGGDINMSNLYGLTPLGIACRDDDTIMARLLIRFDANVDQTDDHMITPLGYCVHAGNISTTQLLLEKGADVNLVCDNTFPALSVASQRGFKSLAELLLRYSADINKLDLNGLSPLHLAVSNNNFDMTKNLLHHGSDVNLCGEGMHVSTPLCTACKEGYLDVARLLIDHGADVNLCDGKGRYPLRYSVEGNFSDLCRYLLKHDADVDASGSGALASSPLCTACSIGNTSLVKLLLQHNADTNKCNGMNKSPHELAEGRNHSDIIKLLQNQKYPNDRTSEQYFIWYCVIISVGIALACYMLSLESLLG